MKKQIVITGLLIFLLFPHSVSAARNISIISDKPSLFGTEEIILIASVSGFTNGEKIYIKGAFFKEGTSNYFGFTKFNDSWIKYSETSTSQREITIGPWDLKTNVRADFEDTGYSGKGSYNLKLGFYYQTSSGLSSVNWSTNNLVINLDAPSPTPTPEEAKSSSLVTKSSSPTLTPSSTPKFTPHPTKNPIFDKIAGEIRSASEYAKFRNSIPEKKAQKAKILGAKTESDAMPFWIIAGFLLIIVSGTWLAVKYYKIDKDEY